MDSEYLHDLGAALVDLRVELTVIVVGPRGRASTPTAPPGLLAISTLLSALDDGPGLRLVWAAGPEGVAGALVAPIVSPSVSWKGPLELAEGASLPVKAREGGEGWDGGWGGVGCYGLQAGSGSGSGSGTGSGSGSGSGSGRHPSPSVLHPWIHRRPPSSWRPPTPSTYSPHRGATAARAPRGGRGRGKE